MSEIFYTGIDRFDARSSEQQPLSLKRAHQILSATGARIKLVPGEPEQSLVRAANFMTGTDLLIFGDELQPSSVSWFYVPRLLHNESAVYQQAAGDDGTNVYRAVSVEKVKQLAQSHHRRQAA